MPLIYIYVCIYICVCIYMYIYTYIHIYMYVFATEVAYIYQPMKLVFSVLVFVIRRCRNF